MITNTTFETDVTGLASPSEDKRMVATIVHAFEADPAARWLYPDDAAYAESFPEFVRAFAGRAIEDGTAHYAPGFAGAAFWFAPSVHGDDQAVIALIERTVPSSRLDDAFELFDQMGEIHPREPHWYLPMIGVAPALQGRGHGSALLSHGLAICDREGMPAYLESSSAANLPLYRRHGFRQIAELKAGSSPPIYPMLREPQPVSQY